METKIIEIKLTDLEQIQCLLKGKFEIVDYSLLQKFHSMIGDELKRRDSQLLIVTTPKGNYQQQSL